MTHAAKGVPDGASAVIPRLFCRDPDVEIDFCTQAFRAAELVRRAGPDGTVVHALLTVGAAMVMIESEWPGFANRAPAPDGSSPVALYVYVDDVDAAVERAVARAATVLVPPTDQFWGDRTAWVLDPQGHVWTFATRIEEPTEEERRRRLKEINQRAAHQPRV
jgi:PhnB protein